VEVHESDVRDFETLLGSRGVGPATVRSLSLLAELIYGAPASHRDLTVPPPAVPPPAGAAGQAADGGQERGHKGLQGHKGQEEVVETPATGYAETAAGCFQRSRRASSAAKPATDPGLPAATWKWADYSYAHGGKDGFPFPVDRRTYDQSIQVLLEAVRKARIGETEKAEALQRLSRLAGKSE